MDQSLRKRKLSEDGSEGDEVKVKKSKSFLQVLAKYDKPSGDKQIINKLRKQGVKLVDAKLVELFMEYFNTGEKMVKITIILQ